MPKNLNSIKFFVLYALIIFFLGFSLRFFDISQENIWYDESYTVLNLKQPDLVTMTKTIEKNELYNPPLYYVVMYGWTKLFGFSEFALRIFSAIFGSLSLIIIYFLGKELFNRKVGLIAELLFAISPLQISFSQEARSYAFFIFLTLCSFYFFIRYMKEPKKIHGFMYVITTVFSLYTLVLGFFSILLQNLIFFFFYYPEKQKIMKKWLFSQICILIFLLPGIKWFIFSTYGNLNEGLLMFVYRYGLPSFFMYIPTFLFFVIGVTSLLLIFIQYKKKYSLFNRIIPNPILNKKMLFIFILLLLIFELIIIPLVWRSFFFVRYTIFLYFILYLFIAVNLSKLKTKHLLFLMIPIILTNIFLISNYYKTPIKTPWNEIALFVDKNSSPDDIILFGGGKYAFDYYYKGNLNRIEFFPVDNYFTTFEDARKNINEIILKNPSKKGIFFITFRQWLSRPYINFLNLNYQLSYKKEFLDVGLYYYKVSGDKK
jgi:uncharacterized membrane protein